MADGVGRRLSDWERLDRATEVAKRDLASVQTDIEGLERKLELIDTGQFSAADRDIFDRRLARAKVKVIGARRRFEEAQAAQVEYESTRAKFRKPPDETAKGPVLEGEHVATEIERIKREAGLPA